MTGTDDRRPVVAVVMGSDSDWPVMAAAADALAEFGVRYEADVVSAHRMPQDMISYGSRAADRFHDHGAGYALREGIEIVHAPDFRVAWHRSAEGL